MARRSRKAGDKLVGGAIVLAAVVYPFVWLYEQIGGFGYLVLIASASGIWFYLSSQRKAKDAERFEADVLSTLGRRLDPETARAMNAKYSKSNHRRAELLRFIQIFNDSVEISLNSKKPDTAESRFSLARETYQKIKAYRDIMGPRLSWELETKFQHLEANFVSALTLNRARSYIEKAESLKTEKSKMRYLQEALDVLEDGLLRGAGASPDVVALAQEVRAKVCERT